MPMDTRGLPALARACRFIFVLFEVGVILIVGSAILDLTLNLGWGYQWRDVAFGIPLAEAGFAVHAIIIAIFRIMGVRR